MTTHTILRTILIMLTSIYLAAGTLWAEPIKPTGFIEKADQWIDDVLSWKTIDEKRDIKFKLGGQVRHRLEYRDDFNFNDATFEDSAINLFRFRLNGTLDITKYARFFAQGQSSLSFSDREAHTSAAFANEIDLHQLYGLFKSPVKQVPISVQVGRQKLVYGDQRFVGGFEWSNVARVFDAVKVVVNPFERFQVDAWYSQVVRVLKDRADSGQHDDHFYGIYTQAGPYKDQTLDTFLFIRHNTDNEIRGEVSGRFGQLKEYTLGNRFKGKAGNFDYGLEWAWQLGSRAHEDIRAWAFHTGVGYTFSDYAWKPRIDFEYNHGSGDDDPKDGTVENFDNLFPTNHLHYGYMDFVSLRNTNNFKVGVRAKPIKKLSLKLDYHCFFLDTDGSALFNAGQAAIRTGRGDVSNFVGQELDFLTKYRLSRHFDFLLGYSHFFPGGFIDDTGESDHADFFYFQTMFHF